MNYSELIKSALQALRSNLLRTLLTMLGIVIGIASVILIIALGEGATASISGQLASFGTNTIFVIPGSDEQGQRGPPGTQLQTLTLDDTTALSDATRIQNIVYVAPVVSKATQASTNGQTKNVTVQGVGPQYAIIQSFDLVFGEFFSQEQDDSLARVAVLGSEIVTDLYGEGAEPIGETLRIDNKSFRVIGVMAEKDSSVFSNPNTGIYIPVRTMMKVLLGQDSIASIMVQAENAELIDQTVADMKVLLREIHDLADGEADDFTVRSAQQALAIIGNVTNLLTALLAGIAGISLLVGGIGIMNIMLVTVTERTKEIGLLKAIGATHRDILTQFLIESLVLTLVGGIIGMTAGITLAFLITGAAGIPFIISPVAVVMAVGVSSSVGIVFGFYPAWRASKLSPIDALRHE